MVIEFHRCSLDGAITQCRCVINQVASCGSLISALSSRELHADDRWHRRQRENRGNCVNTSATNEDKALTYQLPSSFRQRHSVQFTLLLVHLILRKPHHSHHIRSHHLSLPRPFISELKLISFKTPWTYTEISGHWRLFVLVSFFLATCARLSWSYSAFQTTLNSFIVS